MSSPKQKQYSQASIATSQNLKTIAQTILAHDDQLSRFSLPEVQEMVDIVSEMVPAGNVPGLILNGLARLSSRRPTQDIVERDINVLFKGVEQALDKAAYGAFFAGPAAVIWGYQNLIKLAGKDPDDAFPQGTWQFYVDYALREDTARHTNETHGFDTLLGRHNITIGRVDRMTAWVMATMQTLWNYDELLENEWRERVYTAVVDELSDGEYAHLYRQWAKQRPYGRRADAGALTYPEYRRSKFDAFMSQALADWSPQKRQEWEAKVQKRAETELPKYQEQMSICSYLKPEKYSEQHIPFSIADAAIGLIHRGSYYLLPLYQRNGSRRDIMTLRNQVAAIMGDMVAAPPARLERLAITQRTALSNLRTQVNPQAAASWEALNRAPILINMDQRPPEQPLAAIRQAERGTGDHALTLFDTGQTFVFDQSHIYFDGAWGAALAEIMTYEALAWAQYLAALPPPQPNPSAVHALDFNWQPQEDEKIAAAPRIVTEISAESDQINLRSILSLRKWFKQRNEHLRLTVNDLLVLYRSIHAVTYEPTAEIVDQLNALRERADGQAAVEKALEIVHNQSNPAILIPIDAGRTNPAERLYPMSFDVPLHALQEFELLSLHRQTLEALETYKSAAGDRTAAYNTFYDLQRQYLGTMAGFSAVFSRAKEIASAGEGTSSGSIRLLAHMPRQLQQILDSVPSKIDLLNDIIKGKEVFSNVGAIVSSSSLTRFITAKDDNEKKTLAWGVITDSKGIMRLSLRDFRPHVRALADIGETALAQAITQHYVDSYVQGLNDYINDLRRITFTSRETKLSR